jgi:hypothetical protein
MDGTYKFAELNTIKLSGKKTSSSNLENIESKRDKIDTEVQKAEIKKSDNNE